MAPFSIIIYIASAKGKPILFPTYFVYGGDIYTYHEKKRIGSVSEVRVLDINMDGTEIFFLQGDSIFGVSNSGLSAPLTVPEEMKNWKQLSLNTNFNIEGDSVYFPTIDKAKETVYSNNLFATPNGFALLNTNSRTRPVIREFSEAYIFDRTANAYVKLDPTLYELYLTGYKHDGRNYFESRLISNDFDMSALRWLQSNYNTPTNWLSDGRFLTHRDLIWNEKRVEIADIDQLKNVYEDMFTDGINFYWYSYGEIRIIPIKSLGIPVELNLTKKAYIR